MKKESEELLEARAEALIANHDNLLKDLIAIRKKHNLNQGEVAERMGVTQPAVAQFERYDANPTLDTVRRYAMAVGARLHTKVEDDIIKDSAYEAGSPLFQSRVVNKTVVANINTKRMQWGPTTSVKGAAR